MKIETAKYNAWNRNRVMNAEAERIYVETKKNEINQNLIDGNDINLADYVDSPELFDYAQRKQATHSVTHSKVLQTHKI